ncbi:hypothetical protein MMC11_001281 [Xylographa trunciseda]|nr:hypothetical protein [Xylographa trunciseda]
MVDAIFAFRFIIPLRNRFFNLWFHGWVAISFIGSPVEQRGTWYALILRGAEPYGVLIEEQDGYGLQMGRAISPLPEEEDGGEEDEDEWEDVTDGEEDDDD